MLFSVGISDDILRSGTLRFDYVSTTKAPVRARPMKPAKFLALLACLRHDIREALQPMRELLRRPTRTDDEDFGARMTSDVLRREEELDTISRERALRSICGANVLTGDPIRHSDDSPPNRVYLAVVQKVENDSSSGGTDHSNQRVLVHHLQSADAREPKPDKSQESADGQSADHNTGRTARVRRHLHRPVDTSASGLSRVPPGFWDLTIEEMDIESDDDEIADNYKDNPNLLFRAQRALAEIVADLRLMLRGHFFDIRQAVQVC